MHAAEHTRPKSVYPIVAVGLITFSFSPILVRFATDAPPIAVAALRTVFAVLVLAPFALRERRRRPTRLTRKEKVLVLLSGVFLAGHFITWIESLYLTTVASASILVASSPIVLAALGFAFLGERLSPAVIVAILAAVAGAVVMSVGDAGSGASAPNPVLGNVLAASATLLFSFYFLIGRVVRQRVDWLAYVFPVYTVIAVTTVLVCLLRGVSLIGYTPVVYGLCLAMAIGPQVIGHGAFSFAVRYFSATLLGLLGLTEPLGATVYAYFLFGEVPGRTSLIGMIIVLVAVAAALVFSRERRSETIAPTVSAD